MSNPTDQVLRDSQWEKNYFLVNEVASLSSVMMDGPAGRCTVEAMDSRGARCDAAAMESLPMPTLRQISSVPTPPP